MGAMVLTTGMIFLYAVCANGIVANFLAANGIKFGKMDLAKVPNAANI